MTDLVVKENRSARLTQKGTYVLTKREWSFQGDKPDYETIAYMTRKQAIAVVSTGLAQAFNTDLEKYWKAA